MTQETFVQAARTELRGRRSAVYSEAYVRLQLSKIIKRSPLWAEYRDEEHEEYADREFQRFIDGDGIGSFYFEVKRGWGVECSVNVKFGWTGTEQTDEYTVVLQHTNVTVSWSSTSRDVAAAQASVALYQEMTNLAATLQAKANEYDIATLRPLPQS